MTEATQTAAQRWNQNVETERVTFSSGNTAEIIPPSYLDLVDDAGNPRSFMTEVGASEVAADADSVPTPEAVQKRVKAIAGMREFAQDLMVKCFVSPKVVRENPDPEADEISLAMVSSKDLEEWFQYALQRLGVSGGALAGANKSTAQSGGSIPTVADLSSVPDTPQ